VAAAEVIPAPASLARKLKEWRRKRISKTPEVGVFIAKAKKAAEGP
jgi:hypothetical protein